VTSLPTIRLLLTTFLLFFLLACYSKVVSLWYLQHAYDVLWSNSPLLCYFLNPLPSPPGF
jgi:hypothetical protein